MSRLIWLHGHRKYSMSPNTSRTNSPQIDCEQQVPWKMDDFDLLRRLRHSEHEVNYLAREKKSKFVFNLKIIRREALTNRKDGLKKELEKLFLLKHPNIGRVYGYFPHEKCLVLIVQYAGKETLRDALDGKGPFNEQDAAKLIRQIILGLQCLHSDNIVYSYLNPENIFVECDEKIMLNPFSLYSKSDSCLKYGAPDQVMDYRSDIWSLGVLLLEMICGKPKRSSEPQSFRSVGTIGGHQIPSNASAELLRLLRNSIAKDPAQRASLGELLASPWIGKNTGLRANGQPVADLLHTSVRTSPNSVNDENESTTSPRSFGTLRSIENLHRF